MSKPNNKSETDIDLRPTFQPSQKETIVGNDYSTTATSSVYGSSTHSTEFSADGTSTVDADGTSIVATDGTSTVDTDGTSIADADGTSTVDETGSVTVNKEGTTSIEISEKDTILDDDYSSEISPTDSYSTVSSTTFHSSSSKDDSLVYITSTGETTPDYDMNFYNDIPAGGKD